MTYRSRLVVFSAAIASLVGCAGEPPLPRDSGAADAPEGEPSPDADLDSERDGDGADADAPPADAEAADCAPGYQDNDGDGLCGPTCETAGVLCRGPAHCDDSSGTLLCVCDDGYQDRDGDGSCRADCATSEMECGVGGRCEDLSGTALCFCLEGYQDEDGDGRCEPACESAPAHCGAHGECDDSSGRLSCVCEAGYLGELCDRCRAGYQDNDGDGSCLPDCRTALLACPGASHCEDLEGAPDCVCDAGHEGPGCSSCAWGYQDNDGDGSCLPDCSTALVPCIGPGRCDDSSGAALCACEPGSQDNDRDGTCLADCGSAAPACADHELCDDLSGTAECVCAPGYQDNDGDGACLPDCATAALSCEARRHCDDRSGVASCVCDRGYAGDDCESCAPGFEAVVGGCAADHEWGFLVYMNADNGLEPFGLADLAEMEDAGSSDEVHVVALLDTFTGGGSAYYVEPGAARVVESWGEPDMGDWRTLRDFGAWAVRRYPARRYALVLWDHGDGWKSGAPAEGVRGISTDEHGTRAGISVSNGDLGRALAGIVDALEGERLALVGFDACLMGMWEVAQAVSPHADVMVASSENEPVEGWPYRVVLRGLLSDPRAEAEDLARDIVDDYHATSPLHFTLAATDLRALGPAGTALDELAAALLARPELYPEVEAARAAAQGFDDPTFRDLADFAERLALLPAVAPVVSAAADRLGVALALAITASRAQPSHPGSHGLSIYLPARASSVDPAYLAAAWSAGSLWDELLVELTTPF